jgi:hypothetical protein
MQRISTTVIGLVGDGARAGAEGLGRAPNIRVELPDPAAPPLDRAAAAWQAATSTQLPCLVHDADPLALVADAWVRRFDQQGTTRRHWYLGLLHRAAPSRVVLADVDRVVPDQA